VIEQELSDYRPSRRLVYLSNTMGSATTIFELEPDGTGMRVKVIGQANPPGLRKLIDPLMAMMMRPHLNDVVAGIAREPGTEQPEPA
jgi:hypothetical protein